jgi:hypothetical protein
VSELVQAAPGKCVPAALEQPKRAKTPSALRPTVRPGADQYPRFFRHSDLLIRVAWSKKEKKEYEHKAPYPVVKALVDAMVQAGADGRIFSTDKILPLRDTEGGEVPSYQAYVAIALMKQMALIDQHGRQGYSVPRLAEFRDAVESVWQKLPKH